MVAFAVAIFEVADLNTCHKVMPLAAKDKPLLQLRSILDQSASGSYWSVLLDCSS